MKNKTKILFLIIGVISPFIGIFSGIYGIQQIKNYYEPYLFSIICLIIAAFKVWFLSRFIKSKFVLNKEQVKSYPKFLIFLSACCIGLTLLIGSSINSALSSISIHDKFKVINKTSQAYSFGRPGGNWLHISMNGENEKLKCKFKYWKTIDIDDYINISEYKSKLGFDYLILNDE